MRYPIYITYRAYHAGTPWVSSNPLDPRHEGYGSDKAFSVDHMVRAGSDDQAALIKYHDVKGIKLEEIKYRDMNEEVEK